MISTEEDIYTFKPEHLKGFAVLEKVEEMFIEGYLNFIANDLIGMTKYIGLCKIFLSGKIKDNVEIYESKNLIVIVISSISGSTVYAYRSKQLLNITGNLKEVNYY